MKIKVVPTVKEMQMHADEQRCAGRRLALVPTMGALHEGHLALAREGRKRADHVIVSIFVNPTQFGPSEDYTRYPRTFEEDLKALEHEDLADSVFVPSLEELYPKRRIQDNLTWVNVDFLGDHLCGKYRPGHFRGVTTVVAKLFVACKPHIAVFGLKDAQQFKIIERMTHDLLFDIEIVGISTVREEDGLALSSRNIYLSAQERAQATVLSQSLEEAKHRIEEGEQHSEAIVEMLRQKIGRASDARVQYAEVVDASTLQPITRINPGQEVLTAVAVYFGNTRLIDNVFVRAPLP